MRNHSQNCHRAISGVISAIFLFTLSSPVFGADLPTHPPAPKSVGGEICFPVSEGERILKDLEQGEACKEVVAAGEGVIAAGEARSQALEGRVVEQDRELADARKVIEDTRKAGEQAAKLAAGPWYQRVLNAGKWIALGIVVGFVGGMAK